MEKRRVVITGLGMVSPLGLTAAESWAAARDGRCGIGPITQFDASALPCTLAAEVKDFDPSTAIDRREARKVARFAQFALAAAAEALADSGLDVSAAPEQTGVILSSGIGGLPIIEQQHARGQEKGFDKVSPVSYTHLALFQSIDLELRRQLAALDRMGGKALAEQRYKKFRQIGETREAWRVCN